MPGYQLRALFEPRDREDVCVSMAAPQQRLWTSRASSLARLDPANHSYASQEQNLVFVPNPDGRQLRPPPPPLSPERNDNNNNNNNSSIRTIKKTRVGGNQLHGPKCHTHKNTPGWSQAQRFIASLAPQGRGRSCLEDVLL